jgi:hypothetical protein
MPCGLSPAGAFPSVQALIIIDSAATPITPRIRFSTVLPPVLCASETKSSVPEESDNFKDCRQLQEFLYSQKVRKMFPVGP